MSEICFYKTVNKDTLVFHIFRLYGLVISFAAEGRDSLKDLFSRIFYSSSRHFSSNKFRLFFLFSGFAALVLARAVFARFNFHLAYVYVMLICLSGFWYGIKGGGIASVAAFGIFLSEVLIFRSYPNREMVFGSILLRFMYLVWTGVISGYLSEKIGRDQKSRRPDIPDIIKRSFFNNKNFQILLIALCFAALVLTRKFVGRFNFMLGYLYVLVICLAAFWFGLKGGIISATVASTVFLIELNLYAGMAGREIVLETMSFRLMFYYFVGFTTGYISDADLMLKEKLKKMAFIDELTDFANFRMTVSLLEKEIARSKRYGKETTVIMIDLDDFKKINDSLGHPAGNDALKAFSDVVKRNLRKEDIVGRYGGEEFLVVLPESDSRTAEVVLNKISGALNNDKALNAIFKGEKDLKLTFSAGVASFPKQGTEAAELINMADKALYKAKKEGKNRIVFERRRSLRTRPFNNIIFEIFDPETNDKISYLRINDVSLKGVSLLTDGSLKKNANNELICRFAADGSADKNEFIKCRFVYKKNENNFSKIGLSFTDVPDSMHKKLLESFDFNNIVD